MKLTLGTAAKATGKSKTTIYRAIKSGKLSADYDGEYSIDPSELFRVFEPLQRNVTCNGEWNDTQPLAQPPVTPESVLIEAMKQQLSDRQSTIDDLRKRLDDEASERRKLMAMLAYKPEPENAHKEPPAPNDRLLKKLFRGKGY